MKNSLPGSNQVDVGKLAAIFNKTATSYKYLFFQAILKQLHRRSFTVQILSLRELAEEILEIAWFPHSFFRLSFGVQDQIANILDDLNLDCDDVKQSIIKSAIQQEKKVNTLLRYVPHRLLTVFFGNEIRGKPDARKNEILKHLSIDLFSTRKPFYRFIDQGKIELHSEWIEYLSINFAIVESWVLWKWLGYLQDKNPSVPAISKKLFPPTERQSLNKKIKFWNEILTHQSLSCIYSGETISVDNFSLDHFLPWSFVGHDQLWNLVPVSKSVNSSKGSNIPSLDRYLKKLVHQQSIGLEYSKSYFPDLSWKKYTECYITDLKIPDYSFLLDENYLYRQYQEIVTPLAALAGNSGFTRDWTIETRRLNQSNNTINNATGHKVPSIDKHKKWKVADYFPDLKIACGSFRAGDADATQKIKIAPHYNIKAFQFIAQASGNSMNGGKNPICDGDFLLLEWITPTKAGSITNAILVVEQTGPGSDEEYVLRKVRKSPDGRYIFEANNPHYKDFYSSDYMRQLARFIRVVPNEDVAREIND